MDAELNNKIKEIGSLFGINELPDNMDEIVRFFQISEATKHN